MVGSEKTILIIEDDAGLIELLKEILEDAGNKTACAQSGEEAFKWLRTEKPFLMILDFSLPDMNGKEFIGELIKNGIQLPPFIVSTGQGDERIAVEMMKLGARDYIIKDSNFLEMLPFVIEKVGKVIENEYKLKLAEHALIESNQFNKQIIQSAQEGIIVYDLDLKYQVWNPFMEKLTGLPASEVLGKQPMELFPFLQEVGVIDHLKKVLAGGNVNEIDLPFTIPITGKTGWASDTSAPLLNASGEIIGVITTVRDITERKHAEITLQANEEKQRAMIANIADVIAIVDSNGINRYKSPNIERLFGWKPEDLIGAPTLDNVHPEDFDRIQLTFYDLLNKANATKHLEFRYKCKGGSYKWIELTATNRLQDTAINGILLNYHDISERKNSEVELLEREINYTGLFNTVKQAIYIQNPDLTFIAVNQGAVDMYGHEIEYFIGKTPEVLSAPGKNDLNKVVELVNLAFNGQPQNYEFWGIRKDGSIFPKDVWTVKGRYFGKDVLITLATDITERKRAEDALHEREAKYRELYTLMRLMSDTMPDMIWAKDLNNQYIFANKAICKNLLSANDTSEPIGKTDLFFAQRERNLHPEDPNWHTFGELCMDTDVVTIEEMQEMQFDEYGNVKGKFIFLDVHKAPLFDNDGKLIGVVGSGRDITILRQAGEELVIAKEKAEASEHKVRSMFENTLTGFLFFTASGQILEANPAAIRILGSPSLEATKQINVLNFKPLIDNGFTHEIALCINHKKVITNEMSYNSKWGKTVYIKYFLIPIFRNNEIIGIWANLQDLTNLWQTQTALEIAKEKAEESDQLKTAFLNNISHEIRTPLNSIIGFSNFLIGDTVNPGKRENYVQIIQKGCNQLLDIVTNVIEISEIQANQIKLNEKEINLQSVFEQIKNQCIKEAQDKNLELQFDLKLDNNQMVTISDSYKLIQIIKHLINNAIKFTFEGAIIIECRLSENKEYVFTVSDSGIGIQQEMQQKIFEPFRQVEIGAARNYGGNGVGLSIAKAYVELLGGKIELKSQINKGTTIKFTLPYKSVQNRQDIVEPQEFEFNLDTKVILVADDEFSNYILIKEHLADSKAKILHATNGIEAIDYCRNMAKVDIVLMDIKMPKMDGHTAAKRIKAFRDDIPIIAQTAYALESEKKQYEDVFDDYITKPINEEELKQKLMKFIYKK